MRSATVLAMGIWVSFSSLAGEFGYGAEIMTYWRHDLDENEDVDNEFAIQRVTLDLKGSFQNVSGRLALEAVNPFFYDIPGPGPDISMPDSYTYLRYAYASVGELLPGVEFQVEVGLLPTAYVAWSDEHAWPFVFISTGLAEREAVEPPSDLGVALRAEFKGLGATLAVTNGEGGTAAEDDSYKSYALGAEYSLDSGPAAGLSGMLYYRMGSDDSYDSVRNRFGLGLAYEYGDKLGVSGQYIHCRDGTDPTKRRGWSIAGWLSLLGARDLMLFLRYDGFDPDLGTAGDGRDVFIVGMGGEVGAFAWAVDYQTVGDDADPANDDASIYFHTSVRF